MIILCLFRYYLSLSFTFNCWKNWQRKGLRPLLQVKDQTKDFAVQLLVLESAATMSRLLARSKTSAGSAWFHKIKKKLEKK